MLLLGLLRQFSDHKTSARKAITDTVSLSAPPPTRWVDLILPGVNTACLDSDRTSCTYLTSLSVNPSRLVTNAHEQIGPAQGIPISSTAASFFPAMRAKVLVQTRGWPDDDEGCNGSYRSKICSKDGTSTGRSSSCVSLVHELQAELAGSGDHDGDRGISVTHTTILRGFSTTFQSSRSVAALRSAPRRIVEDRRDLYKGSWTMGVLVPRRR